jgi:hypothetical protein
MNPRPTHKKPLCLDLLQNLHLGLLCVIIITDKGNKPYHLSLITYHLQGD